MRAEFAAFKALLDAVPELPVYTTLIEDGEDRPALYAVAFMQTPRDAGYVLDARRKQEIHTFPVMAVGSSTAEAAWVVELVSDAVRRTRLDVAGRLSTPLRKISSSQIVRDLDAATVFTATDVWRCAFDRA